MSWELLIGIAIGLIWSTLFWYLANQALIWAAIKDRMAWYRRYQELNGAVDELDAQHRKMVNQALEWKRQRDQAVERLSESDFRTN